jgi:Raf kinase inhibitor-like YbhB/YbcL family protein
MRNPDKLTRSGWWHWNVYNTSADLSSLPSNAGDPDKNLMPPAIMQDRTDYGSVKYGRPCPPRGNPIRTTVTSACTP